MRALCLVVVLLVSGCARRSATNGPTDRELLAAALNTFMTATPQPAGTTLWLTNEDDSECDRVDLVTPQRARNNPYDALAFEVFENHIVGSRWAALVEGHRHNYARDLKTETHKNVVVKPDVSTVVEDLCFLDEAKKRNVEKVLVYQVLGMARGTSLVHLRLSNARTGVIESSRTLLSTANGVVDRSAQ